MARRYPSLQKPTAAAFKVGAATDLSGTVEVAGADYNSTPAVSGQRRAAGGSVVGVTVGRRFVKLGGGGMYAPKSSDA